MMILASDGVWEFLSSQARTYITYIHTYAYHIANASASPARRAALAAHIGAAMCWRVLHCAAVCCHVLPCAVACWCGC